MNVIVDTSVWSLALRRRRTVRGPEVDELRLLVEEGRVLMMGPIRQELLSGISQEAQFSRLQAGLEPFPDLALEADDHVLAASYFNQCRRHGIQGSNTDFLICAVAVRREAAVFTVDDDFRLYATQLPLRLHAIRA